MNYHLDIQPKKRLRLSPYNYCSNGYYFVTICTNNRECLFGNIYEGKMHLNAAGKMISNTLNAIEREFLGWFVDSQIVMPNHIHAIFRLYKHTINQPNPLSLPELIRNIKSLTSVYYTKQVYLQKWKTFDKHLWQRSYYEVIIKDKKSLNNIRKYIKNNPINW